MKGETPGFWRTPWPYAFLVGVVMLTVLRFSGCLERRPVAPGISGRLPPFELADQSGRPFGSANLGRDVWIVHVFAGGCRSDCPARIEAVRRLRDRLRERGETGIRLVGVRLDAVAGSSPDWTVLSGPDDAVRALLDGLGLHGGPDDHPAELAIVDRDGNVRGVYLPHAEHGLDEVFHRARHVRDAR